MGSGRARHGAPGGQQPLAVERFVHLAYRGRVQGSGFRVQGSGFRLHGSWFMVQVLRVQGSGFRTQGKWFRVQEFRR